MKLILTVLTKGLSLPVCNAAMNENCELGINNVVLQCCN